MKCDNKPVSVIIPAPNAAATLGVQCAAVLGQLGPGDELIIVNNDSSDFTAQVAEKLSRDAPAVKVVHAHHGIGVSYARNVGIAAAAHDFLVFCDADDRVYPGWLEAMRSALCEYDIVGGILAKVENLSNNIDHPGDYSDIDQRPENVVGIGSIFHHWAYPVGANMGFHRAVVEKIGGFDESFVGGHDEVDFAWRAQDAGCVLGEASRAMVDYVNRPSPRAQAKRYRNYARTSIQLWSRHREHLKQPDLISFKGAIRACITCIPDGFRLMVGRGDLASGQRWGWAVGLCEGHVKYRFLHRVPAAHTPKYMRINETPYD